MRVLVLGATGYVGSRLVPALLEAGHDVVASSSSAPDPGRFGWGDLVEWRRCDVADPAQVAAAVDDVEAVCYLVHSLDSRGFRDLDRAGAEHLRDAIDGSAVRRCVYLSGLVPDLAAGERHSEHIASRFEVERTLAEADCSTLALRAGVVIGAGSTSFEVIRQLAAVLLVQPIPAWMHQRVQPVAVTDVVRALVETIAPDGPTGSLDVGGPDIVSYPRLLGLIARAGRTYRLRVPVPIAPIALVGLGSAALSTGPFWTVAALIHSLRHDMVCREDRTWEPADGRPLLSLSDAIDRALGRRGPELPESPLPSDPAWTRPGLIAYLPAPTVVRAGLKLGIERARALTGR